MNKRVWSELEQCHGNGRLLGIKVGSIPLCQKAFVDILCVSHVYVLCLSHMIIDPNPSIHFHRRNIYLLMMTQAKSKRLNYSIIFRNSFMEFIYGIVFPNILKSK